MWDNRFNHRTLGLIARSRRLPGQSGELRASPTRPFRRWCARHGFRASASEGRTEQYLGGDGDMFVLKLYRRLHEGVNPTLKWAAI